MKNEIDYCDSKRKMKKLSVNSEANDWTPALYEWAAVGLFTIFVVAAVAL